MKYTFIHKNDLRKWQLATLAIQQDLQKIFDDKCIDFWCGGGTLIAAVRDKRFIYWDNDLDTFFMFKDYKRILYALWESGLSQKYDIYYHRQGYWQKNHQLDEILKSKSLDEKKLDIALAELSKNMFKVFYNEPVHIQLFQTDNGAPEEYVPIKQYSKHHLTFSRAAYHCDDVEDGQIYAALPDVCMLPMMTMSKFDYLFSSIRFVMDRTLTAILEYLNGYEKTLEQANNYYFKISKNNENKTVFEKIAVDFLKYKLKLITNNAMGCIQLLFNKNERSDGYLAYKPEFFRFQVLPYPIKDIFPLKKIQFEKVTINIPNNPDKILSIQFGNFMKVPEKNHRFALPFFLQGKMD